MQNEVCTPRSTEKPNGSLITTGSGASPESMEDRAVLNRISKMTESAATALDDLESMAEKVTPRKPILLPPTQQITLTPEPPSVREQETNAGMAEILSALQALQGQLAHLQAKSDEAERKNAVLEQALLLQTTDTIQTQTAHKIQTQTSDKIQTLPHTPPHRPTTLTSVTPQRVQAIGLPTMPLILPRTDDAMLMQIENHNDLRQTDPQQVMDTYHRQTADYHSLYINFKEQNRGYTFGIDFGCHGGDALHSAVAQFREGLNLYNHPTDWTCIILTLRQFTRSCDRTTRMLTLETIDDYLNTEHEDVQQLSKNITTGAIHRQTAYQPTSFADTPGFARLSSSHNSNFAACGQDLLDMVVYKVAQAQSSILSEVQYRDKYRRTRPGRTYLDTVQTLHNNYDDWCRAAGNTECSTPRDRIDALIGLMQLARSDQKLTTRFFRKLDQLSLSHTTITYHRAEGILRAEAAALDKQELKQHEFDTLLPVGVAEFIAGGIKQPQPQQHPQQQQLTIESGSATDTNTHAACSICHNPRHKTDRCLWWLSNKNICRHWFLHSVGQNAEGCRHGDDCQRKHTLSGIGSPTSMEIDRATEQCAQHSTSPSTKASFHKAKTLPIKCHMETGYCSEDDAY